MESLVLRIAYPKGNRQRGKLAGSKNIRPLLKRKLNAAWKSRCSELMGKKPVSAKKANTKKKALNKSAKKDKPLKGLLNPYQRIYANYKGKKYRAKVLPNGTIKMIPSGKLYDSPSAAGIAVKGGKATNGWSFWKYKDKYGNLVKLAELRK